MKSEYYLLSLGGLLLLRGPVCCTNRTVTEGFFSVKSTVTEAREEEEDVQAEEGVPRVLQPFVLIDTEWFLSRKECSTLTRGQNI